MRTVFSLRIARELGRRSRMACRKLDPSRGCAEVAKQPFLPIVLISPLLGLAQQATTPLSMPGSYSLDVSVNEVQIHFHADDASGRPVLDLRPEEIDVFDEGKGPNKVVSMQQLHDLPLHVAFVLDTSGSAILQLSRSRRLAEEAASILLSRPHDEAYITTFDRSRHVLSSWSHDSAGVRDTLRATTRTEHNPIDGTSVYDTIFMTCQHGFDSENVVTGTHTLLLFSDGVDTASRSTLEAAIEACRKTDTAVYAFNTSPESGRSETGAATLRLLAEQTGGLLFGTDTEDRALADLQQLSSRLRSEYVLSYRPSSLLGDGAFHHIVLAGPVRVAQINSTPGFYAPANGKAKLRSR